MIKNFFTKIKLFTKRLIGKVVYLSVYLKNNLRSLFNQIKKKKLKSLISLLSKQWKTSFSIFLGMLFLYYGIGAYVSSHINNILDTELKAASLNQRYATASIIHALKSQIDDSPWTPSLPLIFPASILDNVPNFQLGSKNATKYIIKRMASLYLDTPLKEASQLLDYPSNIWLFSQTKDDKLSPGSAKQYRKALTYISDFSKTETIRHPLNLNNLLYQIETIDSLLTSALKDINKQTTEHSTDFIDNKSDNIFFYTQGTLYTIHYYLSGLGKDYQDYIVENELYNELTIALKNLNNAIKLSPTFIKNSSQESVWRANHLIYLAYHISLAQNNLKNIHNIIKQQTFRAISHDN